MSTPTPFEVEVLQALREIKSDVSGLKSDVSGLKSDVSGLKSDVSELKSDMRDVKSQLWTLEENVLDIMDEMRSENQATRSLINQAFEHISDQIAREGKPIQPSLVFRTQRHKTTI